MMTPGQKAARWIETFCIYPNGFNKGQFVVLTTEQRETVMRVFDRTMRPKSGDRWRLISRYFMSPGRVIWRRMFPKSQ